MTVKEKDLKRLRRELERDLEALARVEALLTRRSGAETPEQQSNEKSERGQLKRLCVEALKAAGSQGIRPKDLLEAVKTKGRSFTNDLIGASTVSTVLRRLLNSTPPKVEKRDGVYFWKSGAGRE